MNPKLSVLILTYNQKRYIKETLNGVLSQVTSFPFEIVIGDDCSTDGTAEFCRDLLKNTPHATVHTTGSNLGLIANFHRTRQLCKGKYIALLGGDDIWTDATKLEQQIQSLERERGATLSYTKIAKLIDSTKEIIEEEFPIAKQNAFEQLIKSGNFICASSACFNATAVTESEWQEMRKYKMEDYPLWLTLANKGKIIGISKTMVHYRIRENSISNSSDTTKAIKFIEESRAVAIDYAEKHALHSAKKSIHKRFDLAILSTLKNSGNSSLTQEFLQKTPLYRILSSTRIIKFWIKQRISEISSNRS